MRKKHSVTLNIYNREKKHIENNHISGGGKDENRMVRFPWYNSCMPTNAAAPDSSRKNPIHKQDQKTGDGDWFSDLYCRCVWKKGDTARE